VVATREILLIDDDLSMRAFAARVLTDHGHRVREATDGVIGLSRVAEQAPDLVLVDFVMPRMNGYHFLKALEQKGLIPEVPVILMSSLTDKVGARLLETTRAVECLKKPFDEPTLLAVVERHLADDAVVKTATTQLHPNLQVDDDWLLIASVRERLHGAIADVLASHADVLAQATTREQVFAAITQVLDQLFDETETGEIVDLVRDHDDQEK
jgi:CheY-like chemotaxis protein